MFRALVVVAGIMRGLTGHYSVTKVGGEKVRAFIPDPLPPNPAIEWDHQLQGLSQQAMLALGRLDGLTSLLPDVSQFLLRNSPCLVRGCERERVEFL
ncbi:MAG: hypothetical protein EXS37_00650 [Opitutus sp.]|nr:hypothetical protein [Opitutus sp.]